MNRSKSHGRIIRYVAPSGATLLLPEDIPLEVLIALREKLEKKLAAYAARDSQSASDGLTSKRR